MVKKYFFEYHPFDERGGVNLDGGVVFFEKSLARSPFRYAPAPSSDTRPCPAEGGVGWQPQNSGTKYLYYYHQQPGVIGKA